MQRITFGAAGVWLADISADGKQLLLQYGRTDVSKLPISRTTFVRMDAYTGKVDTLLADTTFINSAQFSPNAQQLLISASPGAFAGIGSEVKAGQTPQGFDYRLYIYDIASRKTTPALRHFNPSVANYEWNKGNNMIYFTADDRMGRNLFRLNPKICKSHAMSCPSHTCRIIVLPQLPSLHPAQYFSDRRRNEHATCILANWARLSHRLATLVQSTLTTYTKM